MLDFGDLLMRLVELLDREPEVRARWQEQYAHVLADEYQDVNRACAYLLQKAGRRGPRALGGRRSAPGDLSISRARPPAKRAFNSTTIFRAGQRLRLGINLPVGTRRSSRSSAGSPRECSRRTRGAAPCRALDALAAAPGWGSLPALTFAVGAGEEGQADGPLCAQIPEFPGGGHPPMQDQAIPGLHQWLRPPIWQSDSKRRGIPTQHLGSLFDRSEVKDMLALVALAAEPEGTTRRAVAQFAEYRVPQAESNCWLRLRASRSVVSAALILLMTAGPFGRDVRTEFALESDQADPLPGGCWALRTRLICSNQAGYLRPLIPRRPETVAARQQLLALSQLLTFCAGITDRLDPQRARRKTQLFLPAPAAVVPVWGGAVGTYASGGRGSACRPAETVTPIKRAGVSGRLSAEPEQGAVPGAGVRWDGSPHRPPCSEKRLMRQRPMERDFCLFFVALSRRRDQLVTVSPIGTQTEPREALARCWIASNRR